jgi:hypothetical protein
VAKWVIKQLIVGITLTTEINLDHLVFKNETTLHVRRDHLSAPSKLKLQQPTLQLLHQSQHVPIVTALIILKPIVLRNRLTNARNKGTIQMKQLMSYWLQLLDNWDMQQLTRFPTPSLLVIQEQHATCDILPVVCLTLFLARQLLLSASNNETM